MKCKKVTQLDPTFCVRDLSGIFEYRFHNWFGGLGLWSYYDGILQFLSRMLSLKNYNRCPQSELRRIHGTELIFNGNIGDKIYLV